MTVEKLIGAKIPKRAEYMRVIIMELSRIADHIVCNAVIGVDTGALTGFVYLFQQREFIYEIFAFVSPVHSLPDSQLLSVFSPDC